MDRSGNERGKILYTSIPTYLIEFASNTASSTTSITNTLPPLTCDTSHTISASSWSYLQTSVSQTLTLFKQTPLHLFDGRDKRPNLVDGLSHLNHQIILGFQFCSQFFQFCICFKSARFKLLTSLLESNTQSIGNLCLSFQCFRPLGEFVAVLILLVVMRNRSVSR